MEKIEFTLIENRTADNIYKDTAIINWYKETIIETVEYTMETTAPDNAYEIKEYTQENGQILYSYKVDTEIQNTETDIEFGKKIVNTRFWLQDSELSWKATTMRAIKEYNI